MPSWSVSSNFLDLLAKLIVQDSGDYFPNCIAMILGHPPAGCRDRNLGATISLVWGAWIHHVSSSVHELFRKVLEPWQHQYEKWKVASLHLDTKSNWDLELAICKAYFCTRQGDKGDEGPAGSIINDLNNEDIKMKIIELKVRII